MIRQALAGLLATATLVVTPSAWADSFKSYLSTPVNNLDPLYLDSDASRQVGQLIHRGLVAYSPTIKAPKYGAYHQVVPALASSWEIGPDKKTYIFRLNKDARFHSGRPVRAADVKYSLERAANPLLGSPDYWAVERLNIKGFSRYQAARRGGIKDPHLLGVEVMDHDIVVITLEEPIPYALELLALPVFSVVPAEDVERWWKDYRTHPVGAGPFQIEELKPGTAPELKRFDRYYEAGLPRTDGIQFELLPQTKDQFQAFTRSEVDHTPLHPDYFEAVLKDPQWNPLGQIKVLQALQLGNLEQSRVVKVPSWSTEYLSMNNQVFPFSEPKVRQAFNYAVDKRSLIQHQLHSYGQLVTGVFPPGFPGATQRAPLYTYDSDAARKLLFEAGWRDLDHDGDVEPWQNPHLDLVLYYRPNDTSYAICQKVQSDLKAVGVTVRLAPLQNWSQPGNAPVFYHARWTPELIDPSELFYPTFQSVQSWTNTSHYRNPRVDELVSQAEDLTYEPRRYDLYREAERLIVEEAPWLYLYHPVTYQLVQKRVSEFVLHPSLPLPYELYDVNAQTASR
ncbi:MAG: ABC transporter substrate-binding protein [Candidatus Sericytochromatia bacterium]